MTLISQMRQFIKPDFTSFQDESNW